MTAFNSVNVTGQWTDGTNFAEGNFLFDACGDFMDSDDIAIVTPVIKGQLNSTGRLWTPGSGNLWVALLASDNFNPGNLNWHVLLRVQGYPTVDVTDITIDFTDGATQGIFGILKNNGYSFPDIEN